MDEAGADDRTRALRERVERDRDRRIAQVRRRAELEAAAILRRARHDATARVREGAQRTRDGARLRVGAAEAELSTRERTRDRELAASTLERAWAALGPELDRRWRDRERRARWWAALVELAARSLPRETGWVVEHPIELAEGELASIVRALAEKSGAAPETRGEPSLRAGLRIAAGGTRLDGSIGGLLARRTAVESRLLAELFARGEKRA